MIRPSFIPPRGQRELRDLTRRRGKLIGIAAGEKNRVDKILQDANVKLSDALSDLFGVSGQMMLEALLEGRALPAEIAELAQKGARKKIPEILASLEQHRMADHHRWMIRHSLEHMRFLEEQLAELDEKIAAKLQELGLVREWELLQTVPAIKEHAAATVWAEMGPDMAPFASEKHLGSWAGLCPGNNESAGKKKSCKPRRGNRFLKAALVESAWGAARKKDCHLKDKFWRIVAKQRDKKKQPAATAVAHSLLNRIYLVLKTGRPYEERGATDLDQRRKDRIIRHHVRRLGRLGLLVRTAPAPSPKRCRKAKKETQ